MYQQKFNNFRSTFMFRRLGTNRPCLSFMFKDSLLRFLRLEINHLRCCNLIRILYIFHESMLCHYFKIIA